MEQTKIYIVGYASYIDGSGQSELYTETKPFLDEKEAEKAHQQNILDIGSNIYDGEDAEVVDDFYLRNKDKSHIEEYDGDNIYKCWIEEHKI